TRRKAIGVYRMFRNAAAANVKRDEVAFIVERRSVRGRIGGAIDAICHVVFTAIHQLNRRVYFLGDGSSLYKMMAVCPLAEAAAQARQSGVGLVGRHTQPRGDSTAYEFRCLDR